MGVYLENKKQFAPLAARIMASLILKGRQGETFENLVNDLKASKSTISTHLTTLQASNQVSYYTKPGDRKKYFILSPDAFLRSLNEMIDNWKEEKEILQEIRAYREKNSRDEEDFQADLSFHSEYLNYLNQVILLMTQLRNRLIENNKLD